MATVRRNLTNLAKLGAARTMIDGFYAFFEEDYFLMIFMSY
jgi:hypothetical protein